ncbi:sigma-70 family RNA polymerase sigma factor [Duganella sp. CY15W]|uniref:RNA polymerase sigma factor n=1 Tax=Duganella sp. CY15W TaxID=2692172 RepID=UPI00136E2BF6|nr:RNA polymerase sigma factor [Duganella sp. CY15W]MYM28718.1 sigma-70 family RNA polymerase sigma factor [Duganella sp. CY15W]
MHDSQRLLDCIPRLRRYARALLGSSADADDLVQDTMARGWDKLSSWRQGSDMRAWLFGIMHNLHIDRLRSQPPACEPLDDTLPIPTADAAAGRLALRDLDSALRLLPPEQREVVLLVALEELSYDEVAALLQIPPGTVMSRLSRGRERLRLLMEGQPLPSPLKVIK